MRAEQAEAVEALRESVRLALLRYNGGLSTYFEVLEAQQQLFPAENALAQTDRDRLLAVVQLYARARRRLGGDGQAGRAGLLADRAVKSAMTRILEGAAPSAPGVTPSPRSTRKAVMAFLGSSMPSTLP